MRRGERFATPASIPKLRPDFIISGVKPPNALVPLQRSLGGVPVVRRNPLAVQSAAGRPRCALRVERLDCVHSGRRVEVLVLARVPALVGVPGRFLQVELQPVQLSAANNT
jgi:hypothetical protein